jgi:hypothetical protein
MDVIYAVQRNTETRTSYMIKPKLLNSALSWIDEPHCTGSPLYYNKQVAPAPRLECAFTIRPFLVELYNAWELLVSEYNVPSPGSPSETSSQGNGLDFPSSLSECAALRHSLRMPSEPIPTTTGKVKEDIVARKMARSCWLAGVIYWRAVVDLVRFEDEVNEREVTELYEILKTMDVNSWTLVPYVHLWL